MTNLQQGAPALHPQQLQRLWLGLPIAAGALLATALVGLVLVPQWLDLQRMLSGCGTCRICGIRRH